MEIALGDIYLRALGRLAKDRDISVEELIVILLGEGIRAAQIELENRLEQRLLGLTEPPPRLN